MVLFLPASSNIPQEFLPKIKPGSHCLTLKHLAFKLFQKAKINSATTQKEFNQILRQRDIEHTQKK